MNFYFSGVAIGRFFRLEYSGSNTRVCNLGHHPPSVEGSKWSKMLPKWIFVTFDPLWPFVSVWDDRKSFFWKFKTAVLTAVLSQFSMHRGLNLTKKEWLEWISSQNGHFNYGRTPNFWQINYRSQVQSGRSRFITKWSIEPKWTVQDDSGRSFELEWTVIRLKVDGPDELKD